MTGPTSLPQPLPEDAFRQAMRQLATGVVMVTTEVDGQPWGLTVSACCSVSVDPPMLLVSVAEQTATAVSIRSSGSFGVSILGQGLIHAARFGSAKGSPKFVSPYCVPPGELAGQSRTPVVAGCLAHIDASVAEELRAGDHVIYVGSVENVLCLGSEEPLVYFEGGYHGLVPAADLGLRALGDAVDSLLYPHPIPLRFRDAAAAARPGAESPSTGVPERKGA